jgi:ABC-type multidrug transport system fused ATPase/permease subunit
MKGNAAQSIQTISLLENDSHLGANDDENLEVVSSSKPNQKFIPEINISNLDFSYPEQSGNLFSQFNLRIKSGEFIAIVGPSGGGKSTLVDLILGVFPPTQGKITISGRSPQDAFGTWNHECSYVPQAIYLMNDSISNNISLSRKLPDNPADSLSRALRISHLEEFINVLPDGLETQIGENGAKLSGGQRQRIGIARAVYGAPHLIILDEATSALDDATQLAITDQLEMLQEETTLIVVAHRISTIKNADRIIYIESGRIAAEGSFEEIQNAIPGFGE